MNMIESSLTELSWKTTLVIEGSIFVNRSLVPLGQDLSWH